MFQEVLREAEGRQPHSYCWNLTNCQTLSPRMLQIVSSDIHNSFTLLPLLHQPGHLSDSFWFRTDCFQDHLLSILQIYIHASDAPWILPISCLLHLVAATSAVDKIQLIEEELGERRIRAAFSEPGHQGPREMSWSCAAITGNYLQLLQ